MTAIYQELRNPFKSLLLVMAFLAFGCGSLNNGMGRNTHIYAGSFDDIKQEVNDVLYSSELEITNAYEKQDGSFRFEATRYRYRDTNTGIPEVNVHVDVIPKGKNKTAVHVIQVINNDLTNNVTTSADYPSKILARLDDRLKRLTEEEQKEKNS